MENPVSAGPSMSMFDGLATLWGLIRCILSPCSSKSPARQPPPPDVDAWAEKRFARFLTGDTKDGNMDIGPPPDWLDDRKLVRARQLHLQYWPLMNNAQVMSLFLSFAFHENTKPLIFTGRSDTAPRARRRYLETALHVHSWALGDIWRPGDPAHRNADAVRGMHRAVASALDGRQLSEITAPGQLPPQVRTCRRPHIAEDLNMVRGGGDDEDEDAATAQQDGGGICPARVISQRGMAATQWFFVGLIINHPEKFGLGHLTDDDLESFIHLWRSIGHRMGVDERHNLCSGSLEEVRAVMLLVERRYLLPRLEAPQADWKAMTHALYDGLGEVFTLCRHDVWRYYLLHDVLGVEAGTAYRALGWRDLWRYRFLRAIYRRANQSPAIHASIRSRAKEEFRAGAEKEKLPKQLTYVLDII